MQQQEGGEVMGQPLTNWGHPVAYHPMLSRFLKSVNAAIFFGQLRYWSDRTDNKLGVYKTSEEWTQETGLSYREQATARKILTDAGFVVETNKRLEHRLYFLIDWDAFNAEFEAWEMQNRPTTVVNFPDCDKRNSPNDENAIRGIANRRSSIETETTTETTADIPSAKPQTGQLALADSVTTETVLQTRCRETWAAYKSAYAQRYGTDPIRNAAVNAKVKQLVQRLGAEAPAVAAFFVTAVGDAFVVRNCHAVGALLQGAEAYRTQWATGQAMTGTKALQMDQTQSNFDAAGDAIALLRAKRGPA
jgi:hypothetical protein